MRPNRARSPRRTAAASPRRAPRRLQLSLASGAFRLLLRPRALQPRPPSARGAAMAPVHVGEGSGSAKSRKRKRRRSTLGEEGKRRRSTKFPPPAPPATSHEPHPPTSDDDGSAQEEKRSTKSPPPAPPAPSHEPRSLTSDDDWYSQAHEPRPTTSDDDRSAQVYAWVAESVRHMLAVDAEHKRLHAEFIKSISEEGTLTVESKFDDTGDGSTESIEARKVALVVSQSIVSLSSFAGEKRIRVCSGFVMRWNDSADTCMILTSATLVRSLNGDNTVISDLMVKVLLPNGSISDGHIFLVDFHYNIAVVEIASDAKLLNVTLAKDIVNKGDVLALGRSYEGGNLMCSRGKIVYKASIFGCSELLVSSCQITMAGVGGPLVNYSGHVLGINFHEKNQTSYLSMAIVSRILEHHQNFGKIIRPWLGLSYNALEAVSLEVLQRIYQKFPEVDKGLYICNVAEGSPADVAGLRVGDILVKCGRRILSTTPEFGAMLLDICKEHAETHGLENTVSWGNIAIEVVTKQRRDGCTMSKNIAADLMKECHYNRWPAPMPSYKPRVINVTPW